MRFFLLISLMFISNNVFSKSKCDQELNNYKHTQIQMKKGQNASSMERLKTKERRLFKALMDCKKNRKKRESRKSSTAKKPIKTNYPIKNKAIKINSPSKIFTDSSIEIKGAFKGKKQIAWVDYYRKLMPKECSKPKSIQKFAKCNEHRKKYAENFYMKWKFLKRVF